ncbi:radical SAM/SPASM domain-containing protein [Listeria costaricensis]|uniref:radical SAM/SPASM domain-containing protein n=1 Tax=Listeria costaricensis TaxID=2026604 RepID=UPI000C08D727|nr:SPASM domain-containing protein [Listeria costaricensis]
MKQISVLIKPASSLCNLRCKYCFYANVSSLREVRSYGKMQETITQKMIDQIFVDLEDGDHLTLAFQGGEPMLVGLDYYQKVVSFVEAQKKNVEVHYAIQTNGTMINSRWCEFFRENDFLVGLSIDGPASYHDLNRIDAKGQGTFQRILKNKGLLDHYQIDYNVLCVLTDSLAEEAEKVFYFLKENQINYIQFIPCLDDLDAKECSNYALTPKRFAAFYRRILDLWLEELERGNYISIKLFDDLCNLLVKRQVTACGILGNCQIQYVIEADGSVYPCDFYVLDEYRLGYIQDQTLRDLFEQDRGKKFLCEGKIVSEMCNDCFFVKMCHGGCKRMKDAVYLDEAGFCGYQDFLRVFLPKLDHILACVRR